MKNQMAKLMIIVIMVVAVDAGYKRGRPIDGPSSFDDFPPYQGARQHPPFQEQHQPFREESFKPRQYMAYRQRPFRQELSYSEPSSFRDQSLARDYSPYKSQQFYNEQSSYKDGSNFGRQFSSFGDSSSHRQQQYENPFRNEQSFQTQSSFSDQDSYQPQLQVFRDDDRLPSDSIQPYTETASVKAIDSYKETDETKRQPLSFGGHSNYLKYGNHGLGFASVPAISSYENDLPLNEDPSTTLAPPTAPTATHKPLLDSTVSSTTATITQGHTLTPTNTKTASRESSPSTTMKGLQLIDAPTTASTQTQSTASAMTMGGKQSPKLNYGPTTLTSASKLPVIATESPIVSFEQNTLPAIQFHTSKLTTAEAPSTFYLPSDIQQKIQQSVLNYLLPGDSKNTIKSEVQNSLLKYVLPEVSSGRGNSNVQNPVVSYFVPEETKDALKSSVQSSWFKQLLQQEPKRGLSFQQFSLPETLNYVSLATLAERPKFTVPSIPIATLSAVSRPLQTINYVPATLPRFSFMGADSSARSSLPLGTVMSSGLSSDMPSLPTSISSSLPGGITTDISAGIPGSMSAGVSNAIPTMNFGQSFQHMEQMRPFQTPGNQQYSTGLQLQLGGFGGIDYSLQRSNSGTRPMELGMAKVGLSLPEIPQPHVPAFAKVPFGRQLW